MIAVPLEQARRVEPWRGLTLSFLLLAISIAACGGSGEGSGEMLEQPAADAGARETTLAAETIVWTQCAKEGQHCSFPGRRNVRYGTTSQSTTLSLADGTTCGNAVFGDPAQGQDKSCAYADDGTESGNSSWLFCAFEWQTCKFSGTRQIRYGTSTENVVSAFTDLVSCMNSVFGDPAYGIGKSCWYESTKERSAPNPTWTLCANESRRCTFMGTRPVRYGTPTVFYIATFADGVLCSNAAFGDPAVAGPKTCSYSSQIVATGTTQAMPPGPSGPNPPIVLNASSSARAGDVVSLQGENFGTAPRVFLEREPSAALPIINRVGTYWLAVQLPASAQGAMILRVDNGTGTSAQVKVNAARPLHLDALQLAPGGAFRMFGRNLLLPGSMPRVSIGGISARIDLSRSDENMLVGVASTATKIGPAATVSVDNGNGSGTAKLDRTIEVVASGSGDPFALGVGWGAAFTAFSKRTLDTTSDLRLSPKVLCNGSQDDAPAVQRAIDLASGDGGGVVRLPAGRCRVATMLTLRSKVIVQGAGKTSTELIYDSNYPVYGVHIDLAGIRNLTLTNSGKSTEGPLLKDSTRVFLQGVRVQLGTSSQMFLTGNRDFVVANSDFVQSGSISHQGPYTFNDSAGLVFDGNTTSWVDGAPAFGRVHDSYLHANRFTRDGRQQNAPGTVHSMTLDFAHRVAVVGNTFDVANGPITNKTRNDGETILTEGGGAVRTENTGTVASAGSNTLTDPANTLQTDPFGTGVIPENYGVAIVAGKGAGQTRRLVAYAKPTLTVDRAWDIVPDTGSHYATFVWGLEKALIKGNALTQNPRGIWLYHTAVRDVDVIDNTISEGGGIFLRSYQNLATKSFMPIYNVLISRNRIVNSTGNWMSYLNSVFVNSDALPFGIAALGIEMRSNQITANQPNLSSSQEDYANTEGFLNMMRVENYDGYESPPMPRVLGSVLVGNSCTNCEAAVRVGTGAGGTTILNTQLVNSATAFADWATTSTPEKSTDTMVR